MSEENGFCVSSLKKYVSEEVKILLTEAAFFHRKVYFNIVVSIRNYFIKYIISK